MKLGKLSQFVGHYLLNRKVLYTTMMKLRASVAKMLVRSQNASELVTFNLQPATASAFPNVVAALAAPGPSVSIGG